MNPINRKEAFMAGNTELTPMTIEEQTLKSIAANDDTLYPLPITNRQDQYRKDILATAGNPNSITTITGTLANPWGDMTEEEIQQLYLDISNAEVNALLTVTITNGNSSTASNTLSVLSDKRNKRTVTTGDGFVISALVFGLNGIINEAGSAAYMANDGSLFSAYFWDGEDFIDLVATEQVQLIKTVLTIIRHPLPEPED